MIVNSYKTTGETTYDDDLTPVLSLFTGISYFIKPYCWIIFFSLLQLQFYVNLLFKRSRASNRGSRFYLRFYLKKQSLSEFLVFSRKKSYSERDMKKCSWYSAKLVSQTMAVFFLFFNVDHTNNNINNIYIHMNLMLW